jgi:hypothetical protein
MWQRGGSSSQQGREQGEVTQLSFLLKTGITGTSANTRQHPLFQPDFQSFSGTYGNRYGH